MTKKAIARRIARDTGMTQYQVMEVVQRTFDEIIRSVVAEGGIELRNFGVFVVKRRAARRARNPRTGEKLITPARNVVTFKPGREMEALVRGKDSSADARKSRATTTKGSSRE